MTAMHAHPGRRTISRRIRAVAGLLAAGILLAGCQGVPSSGPVAAGLTDLEQSDQQVLFNPNRPVEGASAKDIVGGFVDAASSSTDNYAIARQFLSPDYAEQWDPSAGVFIYEGSRPFREPVEGVAILSLSATALLDEHGTLTPTPEGPTTDVRFEVVQVDGEWRISSAPNGIILDQAIFTEVWAPHQLYFADVAGVLVPDTRWFLSRATASTNIVAELIAGPADPLLGAVRSGFPTGTVLAAEAVPIVEGTAKIDLSGEVENADAADRELMSAQLAASLRSVRGVTGFAISVNQTPGFAEGPVAAQPVSGAPKSKFSAVIMGEDGFGFLSTAGFEPLPGIGDAIAALDPSAVTLSLDEPVLAAVLENGRVTVFGAGGPVPVDDRPGVLAPSVDRYEYVWVGSSATPTTVTATRIGRDPVSIAVPWLDGLSLRALRVSPDGSRIAALVADGDSSGVVVGGIMRDREGRPIAVTETAVVSMFLPGAPIDLDWMDETRFVTLTEVGSVARVTIGGPGLFPVEAGSVAEGVSIAGTGSRSQLRVLDAEGALFGLQGSGWQRQANGVELLAKRG
ncbi:MULTISPECIES: GerMN domain-containing protein [unclassified Leucobacter]|uniref:GerMN domain-containing protein n=1 Tax=unclassified Leucobacter TaxID=2621730 RepID=UPI00165E7B2B|nr:MULTISPECIES: GerMN domain-containing protein [unclassified Leucobacter]MBC9927562.1 GerMN domain-containing protein [Leucobacter sp. cx-169]